MQIINFLDIRIIILQILQFYFNYSIIIINLLHHYQPLWKCHINLIILSLHFRIKSEIWKMFPLYCMPHDTCSSFKARNRSRYKHYALRQLLLYVFFTQASVDKRKFHFFSLVYNYTNLPMAYCTISDFNLACFLSR